MEISNEPTVLPMLYKLDSKGAVRCWRAWTELNEDGSAIENNESGIEGGTLSGIPITVTAGKNIGKRNETTPLQQANKKILSKYEKKLKEGYVQDLSEFTQQGVMKALEWDKAGHRMSKIALHQPKLDGIRAKAIMKSTGMVIMSKSNTEHKPFLQDLSWANYLRSEMQLSEEVDGELYIHGLELNEIQSLSSSYKYNTEELREFCEETPEGLRINLNSKTIVDQVYRGMFAPELDVFESGTLTEIGRNKGWVFPGVSLSDIETYGTTDLEFWVFDLPDEVTQAEDRAINLQERYDVPLARAHGLRVVRCGEFNIEDLEEVNEQYVDQGFEGTMIRKPSGLYAFGNRTADLQKFKLFYDAEWIIIGHSIDREGNPTLLFRSELGEEFSCRPKGTRAWRIRLLRDIDSLVGLPATIRYQKLYADSLKPQFGRVIAIRDYE